jgi:hypothetical protein
MKKPFNEKQILQGMQRSGERLIAFGYAESFVINDVTGRGNIVWTAAGSALRKEMQKVFDSIAKGKGQQGQMEFLAFLNFLIEMD